MAYKVPEPPPRDMRHALEVAYDLIHLVEAQIYEMSASIGAQGRRRSKRCKFLLVAIDLTHVG